MGWKIQFQTLEQWKKADKVRIVILQVVDCVKHALNKEVLSIRYDHFAE